LNNAPDNPVQVFINWETRFFVSIHPNLSFEQPVGLSGANPHETRKLGLLPQAKVPKSSGSEWSRRSGMSLFAKDIPTWMLIKWTISNKKIPDNNIRDKKGRLNSLPFLYYSVLMFLLLRLQVVVYCLCR